MIKEFVKIWEKRKHEIETKFSKEHLGSYFNIVKAVIEILHDEEDPCNTPSPERIHEINDGAWQGTLVYVIGSGDYQPNNYWYVMVGYGSCSVCDTLQGIESDNYDNPPNEQQVKDYMILALHILQRLKEM